MSKFILGTVQFGLNYGINNEEGQPAKSSVFQIFDAATKNEINTLDTAEAYGDAHQIIGQYHEFRTSKFKINTKFSSLNSEVFIDQVTQACNTLFIDHIDTCFYHSFLEYKRRSLENHLDQLIKKGLIKKIGVSIYTNEEFDEVINDPIVNVIQIPFNLLDNFSQRGELLMKAKIVGKIIQVRSIFLQGLFFLEPLSLKGNIIGLQEELIMIKNIAQDYGMSISDLCIQYAFYHKEIDQVVIGVNTIEQLKSNINSSRNQISSEIIDRVNKIRVKNTSMLYPYNWR
jgi:aryl-alcohol dehydrogenase-like predicted oxidoreductase